MDPNACLERCAAHLDEGYVSEALYQLSAYYEWRASGGFEPTFSGGVRGDDFAASLAFSLASTKEGF